MIKIIRRLNQITIYDNDFYLTATSFITTNGNGKYSDMDIINLGRIEDFSFETLQTKYNRKKIDQMDQFLFFITKSVKWKNN